MLDYSKTAKEIEVTTNRMNSPGKLTFSCVEDDGNLIEPGSFVKLETDGVKIFCGYLFTCEQKKDKVVTYTAYDQLRYLKANASYTFSNMSLSQIIQRIANDFGLKTGKLEETGYVFPCLIKENTSCLDMIFDALSQTIIQTGVIYLFFDYGGELTLIEAKKLFLNSMLGDRSLVTDYTYVRDINSDTYNRVKLVKKNESSGRTDVYIHEDNDTIKKWGVLQYYDEVDKSLNDAQIDEMCQAYLKYYNRVLQTLTLEAIGLAAIRAGCIIPIRLSDVKVLSTMRFLLAEKVTHKFDGGDHTMSIEVKSFEQLGGDFFNE